MNSVVFCRGETGSMYERSKTPQRVNSGPIYRQVSAPPGPVHSGSYHSHGVAGSNIEHIGPPRVNEFSVEYKPFTPVYLYALEG